MLYFFLFFFFFLSLHGVRFLDPAPGANTFETPRRLESTLHKYRRPAGCIVLAKPRAKLRQRRLQECYSWDEGEHRGCLERIRTRGARSCEFLKTQEEMGMGFRARNILPAIVSLSFFYSGEEYVIYTESQRMKSNRRNSSSFLSFCYITTNCYTIETDCFYVVWNWSNFDPSIGCGFLISVRKSFLRER